MNDTDWMEAFGSELRRLRSDVDAAAAALIASQQHAVRGEEDPAEVARQYAAILGSFTTVPTVRRIGPE